MQGRSVHLPTQQQEAVRYMAAAPKQSLEQYVAGAQPSVSGDVLILFVAISLTAAASQGFASKSPKRTISV